MFQVKFNYAFYWEKANSHANSIVNYWTLQNTGKILNRVLRTEMH